MFAVKCLTCKLLSSKDTVTETVFLNADTVNKASERTCPGDFELLKTLGKGGYGKVVYRYVVILNTTSVCNSNSYQPLVLVNT